jgi:hypothetical protein
MNTVDSLKISKTIAIASLTDESDEKWLSKSPAERLEAMEIMRQIIYGYDPASIRLQRVLTIAQRTSG